MASMAKLISPNLDQPLTVFINPATGRRTPADWATMTADQRENWINNDSDYVYIHPGIGMLSQIQNPSTVVVIYEKQSERGNIGLLYVDGHVEAKPQGQAQQEIEDSKKALGL